MSCEKWLLGVLQKSFPKNFLKIHREIPVQQSLSNNVKSFNFMNPIQDGYFWGCSRMGGGKKALSLKSVTHIL